ncbi:Uncharacterised protein [Chlamydia abortus]|nr:Uncharacterised protein [Chlamydia abortus]
MCVLRDSLAIFRITYNAPVCWPMLSIESKLQGKKVCIQTLSFSLEGGGNVSLRLANLF